MYTTTDTARPGGIRQGLRNAEDWLDRKGKPAWIAAMVLGFIFVWPVGLALLAYMIWGKHMFARSCGQRRTTDTSAGPHWGRHGFRASQSTGNHAFDSYKVDTLRRLEDEQEAFEAFLQRLRNSKDKTEFDTFMKDRARATATQDAAEAGPQTDAEIGAKSSTDTPKAEPKAAPRKGEY